MNFNSVKYLFCEGLKNLLNNIFMALASIGVLTACLLIVGFSVLLKENMKNIITFMGQQSCVVIFLKDQAKQEDVEMLKNSFSSNQEVKSIDYTSKEQARLNFIEKTGNSAVANILKQNNVLPSSLTIHIKNVEKIQDILNIVNDAKYANLIEKVQSPTNFTNTIKEFNKTARVFGSILIVALIIASLVIISNTIRAAVFARRREIAIMKQVGATDGFVRFPFLIEGAAIGIISAAFAFCITGMLYKIICAMLKNNTSQFLNSMFSTLISFKTVGISMGVSFLVCGIASGAIGSMISLRRYLKI